MLRIRKKKFLKFDEKKPEHIAIIMDGNGRWAKKRFLPRSLGHREGVKTIDRIADAVFERGIKYLTLFALSTENWKRPQEEIDGLLDLFKKYIRKNLPKMIKKNIELRIFGNIDAFDEEIKEMIADAEAKTKNGKAGTLGICFNYGGRADIVNAVNKIVDEGKKVDEKTFSDALFTHGIPDPDIVLRTGGEHRISNFLLYQMAYSEIYFTDTLWPDFTEIELDKIIQDFSCTNRRYGGI